MALFIKMIIPCSLVLSTLTFHIALLFHWTSPLRFFQKKTKINISELYTEGSKKLVRKRRIKGNINVIGMEIILKFCILEWRKDWGRKKPRLLLMKLLKPVKSEEAANNNNPHRAPTSAQGYRRLACFAELRLFCWTCMRWSIHQLVRAASQLWRISPWF